MIPDDVQQQLARLEGKLTSAEGMRLASLAAAIPQKQAIVELGSYRGKSACYLGVGSRSGQAASVYAVDLWELHHNSHYAEQDVFQTWRSQVKAFDLHGVVSSIRCDSALLGQLFALPVGLLFIDANHTFDSVRRDFYSWCERIPAGGTVAFHDYVNPKYGAGVKKFVDEHIIGNVDWEDGDVVDSMYIARRTGASASSTTGLTYIENSELLQQLQIRPPQYGLDLATITPVRDDNGIFVDTHSPQYRVLQTKYAHSPLPPLPERVRTHCESCPVGAECRFPSLSVSRREEILHSKIEQQKQWCDTRAWGGTIDVVYPYIDGPARGDELRYSIRSVEKHFIGQTRIWVVGDKPSWYRGNHLPHKRILSGIHRARLDRAAKLKLVTRQRQIADEFVWMMDDVYFLNAVTLQDLRQRWKCGEMDVEKLSAYTPKTAWEREKLLTWRALADRGRPIHDLASHVPVVYEKLKVKKLIRRYQLLKQPLVDDLLYLNEFSNRIPLPAHRLRYLAHGRPGTQQILNHAAHALIMNHPDDGYTPDMQKALCQMFPEPSSCEAAPRPR